MNLKNKNEIELVDILKSFISDKNIIENNLKDLTSHYMTKSMIGLKIDDSYKEGIFNKKSKDEPFFVEVNGFINMMDNQIVWYKDRIEEILELLTQMKD